MSTTAQELLMAHIKSYNHDCVVMFVNDNRVLVEVPMGRRHCLIQLMIMWQWVSRKNWS
jgi:hypothetical protein